MGGEILVIASGLDFLESKPCGNLFISLAQDNLRQNKGVLSYDAHDEKQVYHHIIKNFARIS